MQVKMSQLVRVVKPKFEELGFTYFPHKTSWEGGVFCKKEQHGMYLTLGMTKDRFYDCSFTVDLFYFITTRIPAIWGDIPKKCYIRPGRLLSSEERMKIPIPSEPIDWWWDSLDSDTINSLVKSVELSEDKFIADTALMETIKHSVDAQDLLLVARQIQESVQAGDNFEDTVYQFVPEKAVHEIPREWFCAAEKIGQNLSQKMNKNSVYWDAADAYRMFKLDGLG